MQLQDSSPKRHHEVLNDWQSDKQAFGSWSAFYPFLRFTILREGPERLAMIADVTEGIENLLYRAAATNNTFEGFMEEVKSKRYTWTRIQRMLTHIFTGFTYDIRNTMPTPSYLRLLGMTQEGQRYLNTHKKRLKLPLVSKAAAFSNASLQMDIHASDMYALGIGDVESRVRLRKTSDTHPLTLFISLRVTPNSPMHHPLFSPARFSFSCRFSLPFRQLLHNSSGYSGFTARTSSGKSSSGAKNISITFSGCCNHFKTCTANPPDSTIFQHFSCSSNVITFRKIFIY